LLHALAGRSADAFDRSIDMLVSRLRRRVSLTINGHRGHGYKFIGKVRRVTAASGNGGRRPE
jgi:DNA-binding response OmpR family regulator